MLTVSSAGAPTRPDVSLDRNRLRVSLTQRLVRLRRRKVAGVFPSALCGRTEQSSGKAHPPSTLSFGASSSHARYIFLSLAASFGSYWPTPAPSVVQRALSRQIVA